MASLRAHDVFHCQLMTTCARHVVSMNDQPGAISNGLLRPSTADRSHVPTLEPAELALSCRRGRPQPGSDRAALGLHMPFTLQRPAKTMF